MTREHGRDPESSEAAGTDATTSKDDVPILPRALRARVEGRWLYLDVPYEQKDQARELGAKWDRESKRWRMPLDADWRSFNRWLPELSPRRPSQKRSKPATKSRPKDRPPKPAGYPGLIAQYYLTLVGQDDTDKMADHKFPHDKNRYPSSTGRQRQGLTFDHLERGNVVLEQGDFTRFWSELKGVQDASPAPLEREPGVDDTPTVAVLVAVGSAKWKKDIPPRVLFVVPALVTESGDLFASPTAPIIVNDAHAEPQEAERYPRLGDRDDLASIMDKLDWPPGESWDDAWACTQNLISLLQAAPARDLRDLRTDADGRYPLSVWLVPYEPNDAKFNHLKMLYAQLVASTAAQAPLFASICASPKPRSSLPPAECLDYALNHRGHMSGDFGLDLSQREGLQHLLATPEGRLLAISGPPGTGKTACLQGVIATTLVNATLESASPKPPIILASSATNQAVTNIIGAFANVADDNPSASLASRWLSPIKSYGWFFPSRTAAKKEENHGYQLLQSESGEWNYAGSAQPLQDLLKQDEALAALESEYLRSFRNVFTQGRARTVALACKFLLDELRMLATGSGGGEASSAAESLPGFLGACDRLVTLVTQSGLAERKVSRTRLALRATRDQTLARRSERCAVEIDAREHQVDRLAELAQKHHASMERTGVRSWLSGSAEKHRGALIKTLEPVVGLSKLPTTNQGLLDASEEALAGWRQEIAALSARHTRIGRRAARVRELEADWRTIAEERDATTPELDAVLARVANHVAAYLPADHAALWTREFETGLGDQGTASPNAHPSRQLGRAVAEGGSAQASQLRNLLEQLVDRTIRRRCFNLAARYWEGRWLIETEAAGRESESLEAGLRRQCMLAPVIVGTVYTLPKLLLDDDGDFQLGLADLLIIDEAGQASPDVSTALFGLAKRAIVVGDVEQLKPIWNVGSLQDRAFLRRVGLQDSATKIEERGLAASTGSAMALAQSASAYSHSDGRGITLVRHYRCRPTIIEFCNRLVYDRLTPLIPQTSEDPARLFHPMSYVECEGQAVRDGSVKNPAEAEEMVSWLVETRPVIEAHYNGKAPGAPRPGDESYRDLADLVGIVAPFTAQCEAIKKLLKAGLTASTGDEQGSDKLVERMKLGTVHKLQGAERPIVLFSATNTPGDGGSPFMDRDPDMLNVAISRAKDAFILFGHPGLFFTDDRRAGTSEAPSALLGDYMKTFGRHLYPRKLVIVESPGKVEHIQQVLGRDCRVIATRGHFREIEELNLGSGSAEWRVDDSSEAMVAQIVEALQDMDELVIATDDDREGEAIGWHLVEEARQRSTTDGLHITRMLFHEITDKAIGHGFETRNQWRDSNRASAAIARAIIDKAIGQVMTGVVRERSTSHQRGIGRVRAALLQLIAERDDAAEHAKPAWCVTATASNARASAQMLVTDGPELSAGLTRFSSESDAHAAARSLDERSGLNAEIRKRGFTLGPAEPAATAEILIAAYEQLGLRPDETRDILQDLYEGNRKAVMAAEPDREQSDG